MNPEKFTQKTLTAIQEAQNKALSCGHQQLTTEHILRALIEEDSGIIDCLLDGLKINKTSLSTKLDDALKAMPSVAMHNPSATPNIYLAQSAAQAFEEAAKISAKRGDSFITVETLFDAIMQVGCKAKEIVLGFGVTEQQIQSEIEKLRKGTKATSRESESQFNALKKFTKDITDLAKNNKIDPVIGRDEEIRRTMQILSRRTKNNPILVGDPGVGKTAIVEGLAQRIASKDVPDSLFDHKLLELDLGSLIAGAKYRGEFEERLKAVLKEISQSPTPIILFIDEMHTLVGAGATEGAMDASNLLKPMLARGELRCIGATTLDEYKKYIEKDAALARRFQNIFIQAPSVEDTISILRGLKEKYELHHGVRITDAAIIAAAKLSDRYITDRFLPDKAIDLIDEAASRVRLQVDSKPEKIDELERKILQLKMEKLTLEKETSKESQDRVATLSKELQTLESETQDLNSKWMAEKDKLSTLRSMQEQLDNARAQLESCQRSGDLNRAGELQYGTIPQLEKQIASLEKSKENKMLQETITESEIAHVISKWTGIPLEKLLSGEKAKLLDLEKTLSKNVIGQPQAIAALSKCIRRSRAGLANPDKPIGSFLFLGPTGVGKTELSKAITEVLFNDKRAMLRLDMSEYMEKHSVAKLIGSPPGYVGYEEGGALTESVKRRPYQIILLDEVEKAHPEVFNILLQIMDDGRLSDAKGKTIDFRNTLIIMTSNIGAHHLLKANTPDELKTAHSSVMADLNAHFKPEFLNRLDDIIIFNKLAKDDIKDIVLLQLEKLRNLLAERHISINITENAKQVIGNMGYSSEYGARPLKRVIDAELYNKIGDMILSGEVKENSKINIDEGAKGDIKITVK